MFRHDQLVSREVFEKMKKPKKAEERTDQARAAAKAQPKAKAGARNRSESRGGAPRTSFKYCFDYYKGKCDKEKCPFDHLEKEEVDRRHKEEKAAAKADKRKKREAEKESGAQAPG